MLIQLNNILTTKIDAFLCLVCMCRSRGRNNDNASSTEPRRHRSLQLYRVIRLNMNLESQKALSVASLETQEPSPRSVSRIFVIQLYTALRFLGGWQCKWAENKKLKLRSCLGPRLVECFFPPTSICALA